MLGHFTPLISWKNLVYAAWIVLPTRNYFSANVFRIDRVAQWYLNLPCWNWMVENYFPLTLIHDDENAASDSMTEKERYHPHGLWPWGLWLSLVTGWTKFYPNVTWRILTATPLLMLPYLGDYIQSIGGISADYQICAKALEAGHSLVVSLEDNAFSTVVDNLLKDLLKVSNTLTTLFRRYFKVWKIARSITLFWCWVGGQIM